MTTIPNYRRQARLPYGFEVRFSYSKDEATIRVEWKPYTPPIDNRKGWQRFLEAYSRELDGFKNVIIIMTGKAVFEWKAPSGFRTDARFWVTEVGVEPEE